MTPYIHFEITNYPGLTVFEKNLLLEFLSTITLTPPKIKSIKSKLNAGLPVEYITGYTYFYGDRVNVTTDVLIPREETEQLVTLVINIAKAIPKFTLLDVGTGSGVIMHSVGKHLDGKCNITAIGVDISKNAIKVAKTNTPSSSTTTYKYICGDTLPANLMLDTSLPIVITANLPYLDPLMTDISPKTLQFEPHLSLFSKQGHSHISKLLKLLHQRGINFYLLALEISPQISKKITNTASKLFPNKNISTITDQNDQNRFILIKDQTF